ncbi:MAG: ABC transporter substrate-binding protein [Deltaproteobacteria bacterium]
MTGFPRRISILAVLALVVCLVVTTFVMRGRWWKSMVLGPAEVRVGVMGSMTSGLAQLGQRQINSAILAAEEWNAKGGITGQKIKLLIEDSGDSTTMAMTALDRVLSKNPCAILGPIYSFQLFALFPEVQKERIVLMSTSGTRELTQKNNPWYFRLYPHDGFIKRVCATFAVEELKSRRPALMCVTTEYGKSGHEILVETLKKLNLTPAVETWHNKDDKDMTGQLMAVKRAKADVIISQAHPPDTAILLKQQRELGITVPHVASSAASMPTVHELVGTAMEGVYVEAAAEPNYDSDPRMQAWTKRYVEKFNTRPDSFSILFYDSANFLFEAIKAVGLDRARIADWLRKNRYRGLAGNYVFDKEQNGAFFAVMLQYHMNKGKAIPTVAKKYDFTK